MSCASCGEIVEKMVSVSPFYRHKEGRSTRTRRSKVVVSSPNQRYAVDVYYRKYIVRHWISWRRAWQASWESFSHAGIAPASWRLQRAAWWRSKGPVGQGLVLVKAGVASESHAHAVRGGFRGRESTKEVRGVGSIVAGAVPSMSCTASQVPTVSPQRPEWRSSDLSWRTGLRSQRLWGMAA